MPPPRAPRSTSPLYDAVHFLFVTGEAIRRVQGDRKYKPCEEDLALLRKLYDEMDLLRIAVVRTEWHLRRRLVGESESPAPWDDDGKT